MMLVRVPRRCKSAMVLTVFLLGLPGLAAALEPHQGPKHDPRFIAVSGDHANHLAVSGNGHGKMAGGVRYTRKVESYTVPDLSLVAMDGAGVSLLAALDTHKPVMLNFIFTTCPSICPVLSATFSQVQQELAAEQNGIRMVSISIDPEHDTPAKLREYAKRYGAGSAWWFLTGSLANSVQAQKAFRAYRGSKMNHEPLAFLRAPRQTSWLRIEGFLSAQELASEYHQLMPK